MLFFFDDGRKSLLSKYFKKGPSTLKMEQLFNSENPKMGLNLVKFCQKIMNHADINLPIFVHNCLIYKFMNFYC